MHALKTRYRERLQLRHEASREESTTTVEYTFKLRCNKLDSKEGAYL